MTVLGAVASRLSRGFGRGGAESLSATRQLPFEHRCAISRFARAQPVVVRFVLCLAIALCSIVGCGSQRGTIGANLGRQESGRLFIREVPKGLAAAKAGLQPGDEITLINGRDVRSLDEKAVHAILSGEVGETVKLTVIRGEQVLHVTIERTPAPLR